MALIYIMSDEEDRANEHYFQDLKARIITAGLEPWQIPEMLAAMEGKKQEDELGMPLFAPEQTDDEMENYIPLSMSETDEAVAALRRFGILSVDT